ncbi:hypothetical protein M1432_00955 [Patescibacteria group bacterium]|nr:hypothetical protein [Patescibacteria group bacterium]
MTIEVPERTRTTASLAVAEEEVRMITEAFSREEFLRRPYLKRTMEGRSFHKWVLNRIPEKIEMQMINFSRYICKESIESEKWYRSSGRPPSWSVKQAIALIDQLARNQRPGTEGRLDTNGCSNVFPVHFESDGVAEIIVRVEPKEGQMLWDLAVQGAYRPSYWTVGDRLFFRDS